MSASAAIRSACGTLMTPPCAVVARPVRDSNWSRVRRDEHGGGGAASIRQRASPEQPLPGVQQRVMPPLPGAAPIPLPGINVGDWAGEGGKDGLPHRGRLTGQLRLQPARSRPAAR